MVMEGALVGEVRGDLMAMLACNVAPHGVVACEGTRAVGARHSDALVPLPDVGAQIRLVSVKSLAIWAFQLFTWNCYLRIIKPCKHKS